MSVAYDSTYCYIRMKLYANIHMAQAKTVPIQEIYPNPDNPRIIKNDKFKKLVKSIKEFPQMLKLRPIVVNADNIVLGGNMRLKACIEAGLKEIPIIKAEDLTEEQQREFIIKDNVGFGEWDFEQLANEWDSELLNEWGLNVPDGMGSENDETYTKKIEAPTYEPKEEKPQPMQLFDDTKTKALIEEINNSDIPEQDKYFLVKAAQRHCVFDYQKIADYYAHSDKAVQELMEKSALVIIDFNKAIENGYIELSKGINNLYTEDYDEE